MMRSVLSQAAGHVDRAISAVIHSRSRDSSASKVDRLSHGERMVALAAAEKIYDKPEYFENSDSFFQGVGPVYAREIAVRSFSPGGRVADVTWKSRCEPLNPDVAPEYLRGEANRTSHARLILHNDRPRPTVILVHGYLGGAYRFEERVWPLRWFFDRGLDVALAVLPFHGLRGDPTRVGAPMFPGSEPRITVEGFRQAIIDLRDLRELLVAQGSPAVGVMGMSLGGYTTALMATVEPQLAFAVPMIPLASIADFARDSGRFVGTPAEQDLQHQALESVFRVVSPFGRKSRIEPKRITVLAAEGDRITPLRHAQRIATHLHAPLETFVGGHLLQFGRSTAFRALGRMLGNLGMLDA